MPASYVHQSVAAHAADALSLQDSAAERSALLAGAEGPDPMFFCFRPGKPFAPLVGSLLHTQKTDDFLLALCEACAGDALLRSYCCGFFYALCHGYDLSPVCLCAFPDGRGPVFRQHALHAGTPAGDPALPPRRPRDGAACSDGRFRRAGRRTAQKDCRRAFRALSRVFPDSALSPRRLETCFSDAVSLCRLLRSEDGRRFRTWGSVLSPSSWTRRCTRT